MPKKTTKSNRQPIRNTKKQRRPRVEWTFPRHTVEEALQIAKAIKEKNGGNPFPPDQIAKALNLGAKGNKLFYVTAAAKDYGFTSGTRDSKEIGLTDLGTIAVFPESAEQEEEAKRKAFMNIPVFKEVFDHFKGPNLPEEDFLSNTLERQFDLHRDTHTEFVKVFLENCKYLGLEDYKNKTPRDQEAGADSKRNPEGPDTVIVGEPENDTDLRCFVIMPFSEKTKDFPNGYFDEVLSQLLIPAATEAGFNVETARRQGSDVIQKTIVKELLEADLVLADLTEHNPNVMFELGLRMAVNKPVVLVKSKGTGQIFDVDNMLRVYSYDPRLWTSTLKRDLPNTVDHIKGAWDNKSVHLSYMSLLGQAS